MLDWIQNHQNLGLLLVPLFAFGEACIGIGLFVSGLFLVTAGSLLYANGIASLAEILPLALLGAALGDHAGFYVGHRLGPRFHELRLATRYRANLLRAEDLIRRYGAIAIFIGRFIPAIRSVIPALIGVSGFQRLRYTLVDLLACSLWSTALGFILIGVAGLT